MRKLSIVLIIALFLAATAHAGKNKSKQKKDKRFEPVVKAAAAYAGVYRWPNSEYRLELETDERGDLRGTFVENGRVARVGALELDGAEFTATATFEDGTTRGLEGSFANRILNGEVAFGVRLKQVRVQDFGVVNTFFERME